MSEVIAYYSQFDEWGRLDRESLEFLVNWHYIKQHLPANGHILDNGAGPGKYAMELAKLGYCVTLTDLTPRLVEFAQAKATELGVKQRFTGFYVRNATSLHDFADESFDASLMLGPLYHLQQEEERERAAKELWRVTKPGGVVFVAFRSRINMAFSALQAPARWKPLDRLAAIEQFVQTGIFNHQQSGRFTGAYFFAVDKIVPFMERNGFETIDLLGSTNIGACLSDEQRKHWQDMGEEEYRRLVELLIETAKDRSVLGISSHLLYIGRRQ